MLPKNKRVSRPKLRGNLKNKGITAVSRHMSLRRLEEAGRDKTRVSFVVPGKTTKFAVDRNRLRRRSYAIIEKHPNILSLPGTYIFYFKEGANKITHTELEKEIFYLIEKIVTKSQQNKK